MNFNKNIIVLGVVLSSVYASSVTAETEKPNEITSFKQSASFEHRKSHLSKEPNAPRLVSPAQYERLQQLMTRDKTLKQSISTRLSTKKSASKVNFSFSSASALSTGCSSVSDLIGLTGVDLTNALKAGDLYNCLYGLYDNTLAGSALFSDANLLVVVNEIDTMLTSYDANNAVQAAELEKLVTYLRALHWVESTTGRSFSNNYKVLLNNVFTAYFSGDHFVVFNGDATRNFMVKYEMLVLLTSSKIDRQQYLLRFTEALLGYANSVDRVDNWGVYYQEQSVTLLLTHLFNANVSDEQNFIATVTANPAIMTNLVSFVSNDATWLVDHTREYQWSDTVSELGRLLKLGGDIANAVRPAIQNLLTTYSYDGAGSSGWINAQSMVKNYDSANCSLYGDVCNFNLENYILSGEYACSTTVKLRYQGALSSENLAQTCDALNAGQNKFHQIFATSPQQPVADDFNSALEVVVFSSSSQYEAYAGQFFGINTDNGGMYLEGDPEVEGNQARFIAFQATWLTGFVIWNLEHEQYHYLDGRFNKWGDFSDSPDNSVWWAEGLAEYLSQPNANALAQAPNKTYNLSELFQTTYANSNTTRTYTWGYLANRFMMENHRAEIDNELLPTLRARKYLPVALPEENNEGCTFDWGWQTKPTAQENNWLWLYDDSPENGFNGTGYWVWTCGQPNTGEEPEQLPADTSELPDYTPYEDILSNWGTRFDEEFNLWLDCIVAGNGICATQSEYKVEDIDQNGEVDKRDINAFQRLLRNTASLGLEYDFNQDATVDRRDLRPMMTLCDLPRCAIATTN
ncbi:collagenase [Thalassotalea piscium]